MTLSSLIRNECANHKRGNCVYGGPCEVLEGSPCGIKGTNGRDYLTSSVLPLATILQGYENTPYEYSLIKPDAEKIKVRLCACGGAMPKGRQKCDGCAKRSRKASKAKHKAKEGTEV